jgi:hypothetical protein
LVEGEFSAGGFFERASEAGEWVTVVEVVEVAVVFARGAGDVEAGLAAGPGERDVAPLLLARLACPEDEGAFDGEAELSPCSPDTWLSGLGCLLLVNAGRHPRGVASGLRLTLVSSSPNVERGELHVGG